MRHVGHPSIQKITRVGLLIGGILAAALPSVAQFQSGNQSANLSLPLQSQHAVVSQRLGLTDITITYSRPLVKDRKIFGNLVPYGQVWRAGANENTTIEFIDPVTVDGKPLEKGIYGVHMIPGEDTWTVIFSKDSMSWGSFTYDPANDALRIAVRPQASEFHDALTYDFDQLKPDSATVTMRWEKIAVPFTVAVNVHEVAVASIHNQLRGLQQFAWNGWDDAATYLLENKLDIDEALRDANQSIQIEERYDNLMTKSRILEAVGKNDEAAKLRKTALDRASVIQLHTYARGLQRAGRQTEAFELFRQNAKKHPDSWVVHVGMARMYSGQTDFVNALKEVQTALSLAPAAAKPQVEALIKRLKAQQDINK